MPRRKSTCRYCGQKVYQTPDATAPWLHEVNEQAVCPTSLAAPVEDVPDEEQI